MSKVPDFGLMEEHTQPQQQQQRRQEAAPASTSPARWPPPLPDEVKDEHGVSRYKIYMLFFQQLRGLGGGARTSASYAAEEDAGTREGPGQCLQVRVRHALFIFSDLIFMLGYLSLNGTVLLGATPASLSLITYCW